MGRDVAWPAGGEFDLLEAVNEMDHDQFAMHAAAGCTIASPMAGTGKVITTNCDVAATSNAGCTVAAPAGSAGAGFNSQGGGAFAAYWATNAFAIWYWPHASIPSTLDTAPDPSSWGQPVFSLAASSCNLPKFFTSQQIIIDITL